MIGEYVGSQTNRQLFRDAQSLIPGGVNSPVRAFQAVGGDPYFVVRGEGAHVYDAEGRKYIDLVQSYGAVIAGHAHPQVTEAIQKAAALGTSFGAPTPGEIFLAEEIVNRVPGIEQLRLVNSGTEATMSAIRLARGHTGRNRVIKFSGCYHGHADTLLAAGGSGVATLGLSGSAGVPPSAVADTVVVPYNAVPEITQDDACVIVEPVAANMGLIAPLEGFLPQLRSACDAAGTLLIFDEVITGFRLARGGASEWFGVTPDIACFGKVIGGGLPIGAFGGSEEIMSTLAPVGPVYQAGTLSGNPLATAAGCAALQLLDSAAYQKLYAMTERLSAGIEKVLNGAGLPAIAPRVGSLLGLFLGDNAPTQYDEARTTDEKAYARFFHEMLDRGVAMAPGAYEALFVGLAHTEDVVDTVIGAAAESAASL